MMKQLLLVAGISFAAMAPATAQNSQTPPNVLLIIVDDLGHSDLASYGNFHVRTPHIDSWAYKGCALHRPM